MPQWIDEDELTVPPLTTKEKAWITQLDALFKTMPPRLKILECGDSASIIDWDAVQERDCELHDGNAGKNGVELAILTNGLFKITGVSG